jgi:hypothetical protein
MQRRERSPQPGLVCQYDVVCFDEIAGVSFDALEEAPPMPFDITRQARVFNAYLQYIELKLSGAAIQRHRLANPRRKSQFS